MMCLGSEVFRENRLCPSAAEAGLLDAGNLSSQLTKARQSFIAAATSGEKVHG